jgi:hypothetical protein
MGRRDAERDRQSRAGDDDIASQIHADTFFENVVLPVVPVRLPGGRYGTVRAGGRKDQGPTVASRPLPFAFYLLPLL